ncbi:MAG: hypothetical protein R2788_10045 [Saprospiraceae bacterium]|jgi:hypothetical protein
MKKRILKILALFFVLSFSTPMLLPAQCPMCKIGAESNLKDGGSAGKGLNTGILYMLALPYVLVGTIGFIWWKNRKQDVDEVFK